jgi:predicted DNA-binding protein (MmcQ/YjbR family)
MYLLVDVEQPIAVNLKCDPERAIELRERYDGIQPGYHMNKKHWNTIDLQGSVDEKLILELVKHSYELVLASLPKKVRDEFAH